MYKNYMWRDQFVQLFSGDDTFIRMIIIVESFVVWKKGKQILRSLFLVGLG